MGALRPLPRRSARRHHRLPQAQSRDPRPSTSSSAPSAFPATASISAAASSTSTASPRTNPWPWREPVYDDNPQHAFQPYRDDFPAVPPNPEEGVTATWANELPSHIVDGDLVVPPGKVFAMGDNRTESLDGRYWGFVPRENIVGRPMFVYWSFETPADQINKQSVGERIGFMGHILIHIFDETRWKRTLHLIK